MSKLYPKGFTLLELLVVLVIIGITASITVFNIGNFRSDTLETEAARLQALIRQFSNRALVEGQEIGIFFSTDNNVLQYLFFQYQHEDQSWKELTGDTSAKARFLPDWVQLELIVDGENVAVGEFTDAKSPQLLFLSSGEMSSYIIRLSDPETPDFSYVLSSAQPEATLASNEIEELVN